jgi:hypothetical protein
LAQSFLRNGVVASLDIAVGPNPSVNLLDLLVLTSLQTWSFESNWIASGIGDAGIPAIERLKKAEAEVWTVAKDILSEEQLETIRGLINAWIAENPHRTVVSLVRFREFADERKMSSLTMRQRARGLLKTISEAATVALPGWWNAHSKHIRQLICQWKGLQSGQCWPYVDRKALFEWSRSDAQL